MDSSSSLSSSTEKDVESHDSHFAKIYPTHLENLSDRHKVIILLQIFPGIRPPEVKRALNKCKGKAAFAIDVLLDQVFREDSGLRYQGVNRVKESTLYSHPRNGTARKAPVAATGRPRHSHNTTRFRTKGQVKFSLDRRPRAPFDYKQVAPKNFARPLVKHCNDKSNENAGALPKILDVPVTRQRKDSGKDDGRAKSRRRSKARMRARTKVRALGRL